MNLRPIRTVLATILLIGLYFVPLWSVIWVFGIERLDLILGGHGLIAALLVIQYFAGARGARKAVEAEPIEEDSWIHDRVKRLSHELGVSPPTVYLGDFGVANAFVVGRKNAGSIVLSRSLVDSLTHKELDAVLTHEISHLKSHDTVLMMVGEGLNRHLLTLKYIALSGIRSPASALLMQPVILVLSILRAAILLPLRFISRRREYIADKEAARVCGEQTAARALEQVAGVNNSRSTPRRAEQVDALCVVGVVDSIIERILGTHPPLQKRISKLRHR